MQQFTHDTCETNFTTVTSNGSVVIILAVTSLKNHDAFQFKIK